jgi:hypothetical protein
MLWRLAIPREHVVLPTALPRRCSRRGVFSFRTRDIERLICDPRAQIGGRLLRASPIMIATAPVAPGSASLSADECARLVHLGLEAAPRSGLCAVAGALRGVAGGIRHARRHLLVALRRFWKRFRLRLCRPRRCANVNHSSNHDPNEQTR